MRILRMLLFAFATFAFQPLSANAQALKPDDPDSFARLRTLGNVIADSPRPVHVIYVHGMASDHAGSAWDFVVALAESVGAPPPQTSLYISLPPRVSAPNLSVAGRRVWQEDEWQKNPPFLLRYVVRRSDAPDIVVDEVNYWPLLEPLKCRLLVAPEAQLSGIDKAHLDQCHAPKEKYQYAWLSDADYDLAKRGPYIGGSAAWANGSVKRQLLNWGMSDAVIALGPMQAYFRDMMSAALDQAANYDGRGTDGQTFVIISESLGSFIVMDAAYNANNETANARKVVSQTNELYFFANQFALLELGRVRGVESLPETESVPGVGPTRSLTDQQPSDLLDMWAHDQRGRIVDVPRQIVAFNDPSDALTFNVPKLQRKPSDKIEVVNVMVRNNSFEWFGLAANPMKAHTTYDRNKAILRYMLSNPTHPDTQ